MRRVEITVKLNIAKLNWCNHLPITRGQLIIKQVGSSSDWDFSHLQSLPSMKPVAFFADIPPYSGGTVPALHRTFLLSPSLDTHCFYFVLVTKAQG